MGKLAMMAAWACRAQSALWPRSDANWQKKEAASDGDLFNK
jgi:hypothetical protein